MATLGEYLGAGSGTTKLLLHLNGNSTDSSGNGNNGTDTNITYSQANGKFGRGAGFNGSSSTIKLAISSDFDIYGTSPITESLWFNAAALPSSGKKMRLIVIVESANEGINDKNIMLNSNGSIEFYAYDGATKSALSAASTISTGNWYHAVGTYDGTNLRIYINGVLLATTACSGTYNFTNPRIMLSHYHAPDGYAINYFNGAIDEVIVENRAWSASEVKKQFTYQKGRFGII